MVYYLYFWNWKPQSKQDFLKQIEKDNLRKYEKHNFDKSAPTQKEKMHKLTSLNEEGKKVVYFVQLQHNQTPSSKHKYIL